MSFTAAIPYVHITGGHATIAIDGCAIAITAKYIATITDQRAFIIIVKSTTVIILERVTIITDRRTLCIYYYC
jgi:hypothetical protein